jgi:hypothetical protein
VKSATHYHIKWSSGSFLDWKPFPTKEDATRMAEAIKRWNETYIIAERDDHCERCEAFKSKAKSSVSG